MNYGGGLSSGHLWKVRTVRSGIALRMGTILLSALLSGASVEAQSVSVTTQHNNNQRTGANLSETRLTPAKVRRNFGKLYDLRVTGDIYAQPLYVPHVDLGNNRHKNLVFISTMSNRLYAFDADSDSPCRKDHQSCWETILEPAAPLYRNGTDPNSDFNDAIRQIIRNEIGIIGTPAISTRSGMLYVVTFSEPGGADPDRNYSHYLHAIDIRTGTDRLTPVQIKTDNFFSRRQMQRAAILLTTGNGVPADERVYVAFTSYADDERYEWHGWIFGFDAATLKPLPNVFNTTRDGERGGIWQAGQGPAADENGNIYVMSGNGDFDDGDGTKKGAAGSSFIKLTKDLAVRDMTRDRFTPWNIKDLPDDLDLGSGGPLLLPGTNLVVGGGKEGVLYLLKRDNLGGYREKCANDVSQNNCGQIVQWFQATTPRCITFDQDNFPNDGCPEPAPAINSQDGYHHIHGSPVYWDGPGGPFIYIWGEADRLRRLRFDKAAGKFDFANAVSSSPNVITPTRSMPGAMLSLSADANARKPEDTAILWATHPVCREPKPDRKVCDPEASPKCWCDANIGLVPGILRAMDGSHLTNGSLTELWNSDQDLSGADRLGRVAKFTPVTVANGRVYAASLADPDDPVNRPPGLAVYGIIPSRFLISAPTAIQSGAPVRLKIKAVDDSSDQAVPSYNGTVHFTSTDPKADLPPDSKLTNGTGAFSAVLRTPGRQRIIATDTVRAHIAGTVEIAVRAAKSH